MSALTEWVQQMLHRECDTVIDCHDQARAASAQAHHEAEQALADERERTAVLERELEQDQDRIRGAEQVLGGRIGVAELDLGGDGLHSSVARTFLVYRALAAEAGRCGEEQMAAHMRQLAGLYRDRLLRAQELLVQEADRACDPVAAETAVSAA